MKDAHRPIGQIVRLPSFHQLTPGIQSYRPCENMRKPNHTNLTVIRIHLAWQNILALQGHGALLELPSKTHWRHQEGLEEALKTPPSR